MNHKTDFDKFLEESEELKALLKEFDWPRLNDRDKRMTNIAFKKGKSVGWAEGYEDGYIETTDNHDFPS